MDNINWNLVRMTVGEKIDSLKAEIMYCGCTELNEYKVPKLKRLLAIYEEEYKKLMILQQESNKKKEPKVFYSTEKLINEIKTGSLKNEELIQDKDNIVWRAEEIKELALQKLLDREPFIVI